MSPSSRGLGVYGARLELTMCIRCRFRLERLFSTNNSLYGRFPPLLVEIPSHSSKPALPSVRRTYARGISISRDLEPASHTGKPSQTACQVSQRGRRRRTLERDSLGRLARSNTDDSIKRNFATHRDVQPSSLDDLLGLLIPGRKGKADVKTRLRAWQKEYDESDEAARPYVTSLGGTSSIRAKATSDVDVVQSLKNPAIQLDEDEDFSHTKYAAEDDLETTVGVEAEFLRKGDLVELISKGASVLAIFLRSIGAEHEFLTMTGILTHQTVSRIHLTVSPFVDPKQLKPLLKQLPEKMSLAGQVDTWAPRESSAPLLKAMLDFDKAAKHFYQQYAAKIDNVHDQLALEDDYHYMTTGQITAYITGDPDVSKISGPAILAVHRGLLRSPVGFHISDRYHRFSHSFEIVPKRVVRRFKQALVWLRDLQEASMTLVHSPSSKILSYQVENNPVESFLAKARRIIAASRLTRPPTKTGRVAPDSDSSQQLLRNVHDMRIENKPEFSEEEQCLVQFVESWALQHNVSGPYATTLDALGSRLVRATGCYDDFDIDKMTGFLFLQEIGSILPWENRSGYDHRLRFNSHFPGLKVDRMWKAATAQAASWKFEKPPDVMKDLRKDWGPLEVFTIDPLVTSIIDDGISVEDVHGEPGKYWLHIHIANPTAYIQPGTDIARYAEEVGRTTNLPECAHHMIYPNTVKEYFNVRPGNPILTFSAKVDLDGNLHGKEISSGTVHNCIPLDSSKVQEALAPGSMAHAPRAEYIVGSVANHFSSQEGVQPQTISEPHLAKLRLIQKLATARALKRPNWDIMRFRDSAPTVYADFPRNLTHRYHRRTDRANSWRTYGDPQIRIQAVHFDPQASTERIVELDKIVDDTMILACEIAALWCQERNIPNFYRGTIPNTEIIPPDQFREQVIKPALERTGKLPFLLIKDYAQMATRSNLSSFPIKHEALGLEAYLRVTSPLRRYGELIAHWQIEAALRYEHETGKSLVGCENPEPFLPFSRETIAASFIRVVETECVTHFATCYTQFSWITMFFFRAHYFGEGNLPPTLKVFVKKHDFRKGIIGTLEMMNVDVKVSETEVSEAEDGLQIGDWWECKIADVNAYLGRITMEPVRLLKRMGNELCLDLQSRIARPYTAS